MLIKQKSPSLPRKVALRIFSELPIVFSTEVNLLVPPLFNGLEPLSFASDKAKIV